MDFVKVHSAEDVKTTAALAGKIWNEAYRGIISQGQIDYMLSNLQSEAAILAQCEKGGYEYYLLQEGAENAGYIGVQPQGVALFLSKIYLLARWRGTGLATEAFAFVHSQAKAKGCAFVRLTVNKNNARACRAYEKAGFARVGSVVTDIGGGYVMDDYVYEKAV